MMFYATSGLVAPSSVKDNVRLFIRLTEG